MSDLRGQVFPRGPLIGAAILISCAIALAAAGRATGMGANRLPEGGQALKVRMLRFADQADGGIAVYDAAAGQLATVLAPGSNGFVRGVLRGLNRERRQDGAGAESPYALTAERDGTLWLEDPATGRRIDLNAFGSTNVQAFARLLAAEGNPSH